MNRNHEGDKHPKTRAEGVQTPSDQRSQHWQSQSRSGTAEEMRRSDSSWSSKGSGENQSRR